MESSTLHNKLPKYARVAEEMRRQIGSGVWQKGDRLPRVTELKKQFNVSLDTLDKAMSLLQDDGDVTRMQGKGVYVAQSPIRASTGLIGFIMHSNIQQHPYYMHLLSGFQEQAAVAGVEVVLLSEKSEVPWEKVDGVIYQATTRSIVSIPPGMPQVSLIYTIGDVDSAVADDYVGAYQAMEHLRELGHQRIAMLTSEPYAVSHLRLAAYRDALGAWGIEDPDPWIRVLRDQGQTKQTLEELGYEDMQQWLSEDWHDLGCTAILAQNDETAVGMIQALEEAGLSVPQAVSVVGFDGTEIAYYHRPRLTTVEVPLREIGAQGFALLMDQINIPLEHIAETRLPRRLNLATQLRVGQTTAPVRS